MASPEVGTVGGQFIAASGSENPFSVTVWTSKGGAWVNTATLTPTQPSSGTGFVEVHTVDLTGDGNDEIFFNYYPGNDELGEVYQFTGSAWNLVGSDVALQLNGRRLTGATNFCVPSCADGVNVPYNFVWNGAGFHEQSVDLSGNPIQVVETQGCPAGMQYNEFPPLKLCDKGPLVKDLQAALNAGGLLYWSGQNGPLVDGAFGPDTSTSIRLYQFAHGLQVNGVADGQWFYDLIENYHLSTGHVPGSPPPLGTGSTDYKKAAEKAFTDNQGEGSTAVCDTLASTNVGTTFKCTGTGADGTKFDLVATIDGPTTSWSNPPLVPRPDLPCWMVEATPTTATDSIIQRCRRPRPAQRAQRTGRHSRREDCERRGVRRRRES